MDGLKLRRIREARGYSQQEVADRIGVSTMAISRWERNVSDVPFDKAAAMADMFGIRLGEFGQYNYELVSISDPDEDKILDMSDMTEEERNMVRSYAEFIRSNHGRKD